MEEEFARRDVSLVHDGGVMATVVATLPAPDAIAVWNALTAAAHQDTHAGDVRSRAHKRADALVGWAHQAGQDPQMPVMQGKKRLDTQVVIDAATLFGLADHPGEIIGYGPIPAELARLLAADSQGWRRLVTDPVTGYLLDYGHRTYTPPAALREYVLARDRRCQFPGCDQPSYRCDLDHVEPFTGTPEGGSTSADNLLTVCRRHHQLKTHHRWRVRIHHPNNPEDPDHSDGPDDPDDSEDAAVAGTGMVETDVDCCADGEIDGATSDANTHIDSTPTPTSMPMLSPTEDPTLTSVNPVPPMIEWTSPRGRVHETQRPVHGNPLPHDGDRPRHDEGAQARRARVACTALESRLMTEVLKQK